MREIKFRGKTATVDGPKWVYGYYTRVESFFGSESADYIEVIKDNHMQDYAVIENTVGQYTGLEDKNGVEIYEGDIVYVTSEDENAEIVWCTEMCKFALEFESEWASDFDSFYGKDLEVIGNIYDNMNYWKIKIEHKKAIAFIPQKGLEAEWNRFEFKEE